MSDSGDKYGLVEAQVVEFEEAFGKFISDESKSVPTSKLDDLFAEFGVTKLSDSEYSKYRELFDPTSSGSITLDNYLQGMAALLKDSVNETDVLAAFEAFDVKRSGYVTREQMKHAMSVLAPDADEAQIQSFLEAGDANNTGKIQYRKFISQMTSK